MTTDDGHEVVFRIVCRRKSHKVGEVVREGDNLWLDLFRVGERDGGRWKSKASPSRRSLSSFPLTATRVYCSCDRTILLSHSQIIQAMRDGHDGMTI